MYMVRHEDIHAEITAVLLKGLSQRALSDRENSWIQEKICAIACVDCKRGCYPAAVCFRWQSMALFPDKRHGSRIVSCDPHVGKPEGPAGRKGCSRDL